MRRILTLIFISIATLSQAQQPEAADSVTMADSEERALTVLADYSSRYIAQPISPDAWLIRAWHPGDRLLPHLLPGTERALWLESATMPTIHVAPPKFLDYNSVTLRVGTSGSATITISNGSAYNHMPWNNAPMGYRDARTLSFPLPR